MPTFRLSLLFFKSASNQLINCNLLIHLTYFGHFCQPQIYIKFSFVWYLLIYYNPHIFLTVLCDEHLWSWVFRSWPRTCPRHEIVKSEVECFFKRGFLIYSVLLILLFTKLKVLFILFLMNIFLKIYNTKICT